MTTHSAVTMAFGDADYTFDLGPLAQRLELEDKCGTGLMGILRRLDDARVNDYREVIRLAAIGGGAEPVKALTLVKRYVDGRPVMESIPIARAILMAALVGIPGDDVGKAPAERAKTEADGSPTTAASSAPQSTAPARPSGSAHATSTA